jgi:hypothetical protein
VVGLVNGGMVSLAGDHFRILRTKLEVVRLGNCPEPFQRLVPATEKPLKRFRSSPNVSHTQLKQGVNESPLWKPLLQARKRTTPSAYSLSTYNLSLR